MTKHVALWIDHGEARIFHLNSKKIDALAGATPQVQLRRPDGPEGVDDSERSRRFFHDVARSLEGAKEILLVGPWTAKLGFLRYVHKHDHALEPRIVGVESVDHPSDRQFVAYARKYFEHADSAQ